MAARQRDSGSIPFKEIVAMTVFASQIAIEVLQPPSAVVTVDEVFSIAREGFEQSIELFISSFAHFD